MQSETEGMLIHTVDKWKSGRPVLQEFFRLHPELGVRYTENVYNAFVRTLGPDLMAMDVMRKRALRSPALFDITKFDGAAFDLLTRNRVMRGGS